MKKNVVATVVIGAHTQIYDITQARMQEYADQLQADHIVMTETKLAPLHYAKFELLCRLAEDGYARVLYLDADIHVRQGAPDIFGVYENAAFNEAPHAVPANLTKSVDWIRKKFIPDWPENRYFNSGVLVFTKFGLRKLARTIRGTSPIPGPFFEQDQLNVLMREAGFPTQQLDRKWNQFTGVNWVTDDHAAAAYFLHGNGLSQFDQKVARLKEFVEKYP